MRRRLAAAVLGGAVAIVAAGVLLAASRGQGQDRPGQIGQAKVWIENHGRGEAVPIVVEEVAASASINVRASRQVWEYRTLDLEKSRSRRRAVQSRRRRMGGDWYPAVEPRRSARRAETSEVASTGRQPDVRITNDQMTK